MIENKRIIVTGGSSGMGAALVTGYSKAGAKVVSMDINAIDGETIAAEAGASFVCCDVSDEVSVKSSIAAATELLGGIDVLVHAAGISPTTDPEEMSVALFEKVMTVNMTGTMLLNREIFAHFQDKGGKIINFASGMGVLGAPKKAHYAASKGAVIAWTRSLASAWGKYGITVNAIAPAIWTPMYEATRAQMTAEELKAHEADQARKRPLKGRLGDVEKDFLPFMTFLASDGAGFLTGQLYKIDGGGLMLS
jgi:NAD(P)-dependent dehydrogenase (short-subunit alcohol dehydrogenase family)